MRSLFAIAATAAALAASGCDGSQQEPITVAVYARAGRCTVKEQDVPCNEVAAHLKDTLKIALGREIDVSLTGGEDVPKEDKSIDLIAESIRALGYKDVRTWRFDTK